MADTMDVSQGRGAEVVARPLDLADLSQAIVAGWHDYRRAPLYGIVFAGFYVLGGLFLTFISNGLVWQVVVLALGFPLFAPFAAVGLYEVSRRLERGRALDWPGVLAVIAREKNRQVPWLGGLIVIYFLFYSFLAHMIFALFMGFSTITNISTSWEIFLTPEGMTMVAVQLGLGAVLGMLLFALTVVSLPLALDREIDFVTAMVRSVQVVTGSPVVMIVWAALIGVSMALAMLPAFLGLLVVLPVLGHASWHLYRRAIGDAA